MQAPFLGDARIGDLGQHARLGGHDHQIVIGDDVAGRAQTVAIEGGADLATVGEGHGSRPVPGLHHGGVIFVESTPVGVHRGVLLPGLGDHHHHGLSKRIARHHQQLKAVVEAGRVGLAGIDQRQHLLEVAAEHRRAHHAFAGPHPVVVALDGVDLTVVRQHAVGVGELPGRKGVGRKALMDQGQRGDDAWVLQVEKVFAHLVGQQQAFVDDRAGGHRRDEVFLAVLEPEVLDRVAGGFADDIELALEGVGDHDVATAADEDLADDRLGLTHQRAHLHGRVDRDVAPAEDALALGAHGALEFLLAGQSRGAFFWQEDHADAVLAGRRQGHALAGHLGAIEGVGDLDENAGAVAEELVGAGGAAVIEVEQDLQTLLDDRVASGALDVGNETDAARVVLVGRIVETLSLGQRHVTPPKYQTGENSAAQQHAQAEQSGSDDNFPARARRVMKNGVR